MGWFYAAHLVVLAYEECFILVNINFITKNNKTDSR